MLHTNLDHILSKNAPEANGFTGLPFTFDYENGETVATTSSIQPKAQVKANLDKKIKS